jgi:hypothetical protein
MNVVNDCRVWHQAHIRSHLNGIPQNCAKVIFMFIATKCNASQIDILKLKFPIQI